MPGIAASIQTALNALGLATFTVTIVSTNFVIACACTPNTVNKISYNIAGGGSGDTADFTGTLCGALLTCSAVTATITGTLAVSCADGITFTDTTGAYSSTNTTGYGTPNAPILSDIQSTVFKLYDSTGATLLGTFESSYVPEATGTVGIALTASNFGLANFTPGVTYQISYGIVLSSLKTCLLDTFVYPCCGAAIASNLTTSVSVTENIGNGSITFEDTTGTYDATTNPGGYGSPNYGYDDITSTLITFVLSNGTTVNITDFIPTESVPNVTINAARLEYADTIPDQVMQVTYTVYTGTECQIGYSNNFLLLYGKSQACIDSQILGLLQGTCTCNDENCSSTDYIMKMLFELDAIKIAAQGNIGCIDGKIESFYLKCSGGCSSC